MQTTQNTAFLSRHVNRLLFLLAVFSPCFVSRPVSAQGNTQRGATVGGIAGAVAGAAIGDHNGETGAGAAIGGIIGAFAGGLLGNAEDKQQAYQSQRQYQQNQRQLAEYQRTAVSSNDIVAMTRNGLSEQVILNQIQQRGVQTRPQVAEIIALHQQGVSENIITAMQKAPYRPSQQNRQLGSVRRTPSQQHWDQQIIAPVRTYQSAPYYPPPRCYYYPEPIYHHHRGYSSGIHIRF
jgi:outer membrane lipoprotein SlyB